MWEWPPPGSPPHLQHCIPQLRGPPASHPEATQAAAECPGVLGESPNPRSSRLPTQLGWPCPRAQPLSRRPDFSEQHPPASDTVLGPGTQQGHQHPPWTPTTGSPSIRLASERTWTTWAPGGEPETWAGMVGLPGHGGPPVFSSQAPRPHPGSQQAPTGPGAPPLTPTPASPSTHYAPALPLCRYGGPRRDLTPRASF